MIAPSKLTVAVTSVALICGVALFVAKVLTSNQRAGTSPEPPACKYEENCECAVPREATADRLVLEVIGLTARHTATPASGS